MLLRDLKHIIDNDSVVFVQGKEEKVIFYPSWKEFTATLNDITWDTSVELDLTNGILIKYKNR